MKSPGAPPVALSRRALLGGSAALAVAAGARLGHADALPRDLLRRVADARAPVRTLHGPFTQTRTIGLLAADVHSRGTMALVRPDRLRWQLDPPDEVTFWVGPFGLAYRSAHGGGTVPEAGARIAAALDDMRTLLGGDLERLTKRWSLRVLRDDSTGAELEAVPQDSAPGLHSMRFALGPDLVRPTRAILVETAHDRTTIDFGPLALNDEIPEATMKP